MFVMSYFLSFIYILALLVFFFGYVVIVAGVAIATVVDCNIAAIHMNVKCANWERWRAPQPASIMWRMRERELSELLLPTCCLLLSLLSLLRIGSKLEMRFLEILVILFRWYADDGTLVGSVGWLVRLVHSLNCLSGHQRRWLAICLFYSMIVGMCGWLTD